MEEEDFPIVEDIDYEDDVFFKDKIEEIKYNKDLKRYQKELHIAIAIKISLNTPSFLNSISETIYKNIGGPITCLGDISDVFFYEYGRRINKISDLLSLAEVNQHYNKTFNKNFNNLIRLFLQLREIPLQKSIKYCRKMINNNIEIIKKLTGLHEIFTDKNNRLLCPRVLIFRMVTLCDNQYNIINNATVYIKIKVQYKSGDKNFYFHQNRKDEKLKEGCFSEEAKEILL